MIQRIKMLCLLAGGVWFSLVAVHAGTNEVGGIKGRDPMEGCMGKIVKTDKEWKKQLTPEQYRITRKKGTESAFTGLYEQHHETGTYYCVGCKLSLFNSEEKFDSCSGWPSFWAPAQKEHIKQKKDSSMGMKRVEVLCPRCDAHLGHVFKDGPKPTGLRYCINSEALTFEKKAPLKKQKKEN